MVKNWAVAYMWNAVCPPEFMTDMFISGVHDNVGEGELKFALENIGYIFDGPSDNCSAYFLVPDDAWDDHMRYLYDYSKDHFGGVSIMPFNTLLRMRRRRFICSSW